MLITGGRGRPGAAVLSDRALPTGDSQSLCMMGAFSVAFVTFVTEVAPCCLHHEASFVWRVASFAGS